MDAHYKLLYEVGLYNEDLINLLSTSMDDWKAMSYRQQELMIMQRTVCLLLGNTEELEEQTEDEVDLCSTLGVKRGLDTTPGLEGIRIPLKKKHIEEADTFHDQPSTSGETEIGAIGSSVVSTVTTSSSATDPEVAEEDISSLRIVQVKTHPCPEAYMATLAMENNIARPSGIYDLFDRKEKAFIKVDVGGLWTERCDDFDTFAAGSLSVSAHCFVTTRDGTCLWRYHEGKLRGEMKVRKFMIQRSLEMEKLGILEADINNEPDLLTSVLCGLEINKGLEEWKEDWLREANREVDFDEIYGDATSGPKTLHALKLLENLSHLDEDDREGYVKWKGKLLPDPICHNIPNENSNDSKLVDDYLTFLSDSFPNYKGVSEMNSNGPFDPVLFALNTIDIWNESKRSCFEFLKPSTFNNHKWYLSMLGKGMKRQIHNENLQKGIQVVKSPLKKLKYHLWFDHLLRLMNDTNDLGDDICSFGHLLEESPEHGNPLASVANTATQSLWENLLTSNTAVYASRLTNFYSRLGGAFGLGRTGNFESRRNVVIFPILANVSRVGDPSSGIQRLVSGVCIRGPTHAKGPTDRIQFVTIQTVKDGEENAVMADLMYNGQVVKTEEFSFIITQNSIMKEDTSYLTFVNNALFLPTNLFGIAILEDPKCPTRYDPMSGISSLVVHESKWFLERYTEGIVMASIGNSRDEGYFACLRKMFLIMFSWKRNDACASWDIETFCKKTNDCLIDNPLSMHFHKTVIEILRLFYGKERKGSMPKSVI
uniref:Polymerase PA n=1 Tax=Blattella germanica orthomyxovirus 1 TaxID=3133491 RepID=A0AAT9JQ28_9ORTO